MQTLCTQFDGLADLSIDSGRSGIAIGIESQGSRAKHELRCNNVPPSSSCYPAINLISVDQREMEGRRRARDAAAVVKPRRSQRWVVNELISSRGVEDLCLFGYAGDSHDLSGTASVEWQSLAIL